MRLSQIAITVAAIVLLVGLCWLCTAPTPQAEQSSSEPAAQQQNSPTPLNFPLDFPACPGCNVLLITIDTVRADYLECYGATAVTMPRLCELAARSRLFEQAVSPAPATLPALTSLMTGRVVSNESLSERLALAGEARYAAEVLRDAGYATAAIVDHPALGTLESPGRQSGFLHRGFAQLHNHGSFDVPDTSALVSADAETWLEAHAQGQFFLWLHYFGPHFPYSPTLEDARRFGYDPSHCGRVGEAVTIEELRRLTDTITADELECVRSLYRGELYRTDIWIAEVLTTLSQLGLADRTLVIVTADHGEEFMERGRFGHERTVFEELVHVPLIIRHPRDAQARRIEEPVSTAWLHALLLSDSNLVALRWNPEVLTRTHHDYFDRDKKRFRSEPNAFAIYDAGWKVISTPGVDRTTVFDLTVDPGEQRPLPANEPRAFALAKRLEDWTANPEPPVAPARENLNELLRLDFKRLEKLGYIE